MAGPFRSGFASLIGRPNSGKSTLLNALLGQKISIVSDKPQTTRNRIVGVLTRPAHQIAFVDTPGIHRPMYEMNRRMMALTASAVEGVDIVVLLVDGTAPFGAGERFAVSMLEGARKPVILLINKIDVMRKPDLLPIMDRYGKLFAFEEVIPASALTGDNLEVLERAIASRLPEGRPLFDADTITDQTERFLVAELVREKLLQHTRDELPYTTTVLVSEFREPAEGERGLVEIDAVIYVERDSQKGIVIGKRGSLLKVIGTEARLEIERLLDARVFLSLKVKVKAGWRDNEGLLVRMGLEK